MSDYVGNRLMCRIERPGFPARHTKTNAPAPGAAPQTSKARSIRRVPESSGSATDSTLQMRQCEAGWFGAAAVARVEAEEARQAAASLQ